MPAGSPRKDVAGGVIEGASPTVGVVVWALFASLWLGFMALATTLAWDQIRAQAGMTAMMAAFWLVGLFLAVMAVRAMLHARRFGRSTLQLDAVPARLGGWLSGVVRAPLPVRGAEDVQVSVECLQTVRHTTRSGSRSSWTMWREVKVLDAARCEQGGDHLAIPFAVRLPTNEEVTQKKNSGQVRLLRAEAIDLVGSDMSWHVGVSARLPGVDYRDVFTVPVALPAADAAPAAAAPPRAMPELGGERLARRLPGRLEYRADGDVFVFPVKPLWVVWIIVPALVAAACVVQLVAGGVPIADQVGRDALMWLALGVGALGLLCLLGLMLDTRSIEVKPEAVRVRRGWLGIGFHRTIPRDRIASVVDQASPSSPPTYSVDIRTHDGTTYWAAISLNEPDQARALATRLREILRLPPPEGS